MGKSSAISQSLSVNKSFLHSGRQECFQPGNYFGSKHSSLLYCFWKCGLGFWHSDGLFSPGRNGKSYVFSETPIERLGEGKRERIRLKPKGGLLESRGKADRNIWGFRKKVKNEKSKQGTEVSF